MRVRAARDDRGATSAFVVGVAVVLVVLAGLVADGGGALNARMRLADDLESAAIAGAQATDEEHLRATGELRIDPVEAEQRIRDHLAGKGYESIVYDLTQDGVLVRARLVVRTKTLNLIGIPEFTLEASATANTETLQ
ncbi:pilus assembly protein TadG-related protein [Nocardioides sp. TF02-7]|uniref:pilus assembly protein TadG-related protein n=1 Tax=Nocardioides sp. TF02-7 TaxID=2917724 RepID=UPI001F054525|nr:pilus assembly protein TadG-related protein [Nocardioides sp. TF02-7]UMG93296.1 hypothetical protein MF408_03175 [Nocardioides sp. TF02-7]